MVAAFTTTFCHTLVVRVTTLALHGLARVGAALAVPVWVRGGPALPISVVCVAGEAR